MSLTLMAGFRRWVVFDVVVMFRLAVRRSRATHAHVSPRSELVSDFRKKKMYPRAQTQE
jgi:hypothetical protein